MLDLFGALTTQGLEGGIVEEMGNYVT
ncbi:hypothetical protein NVP3058O_143, partial [Vibrio phage 3.058.O._10N.286.46.B8]